MKRLATKLPWWVGERMDCVKCGSSWEMELADAAQPIDDDFADLHRTPAERKAIADGAEPAPIYYVQVARSIGGTDVAQFICRDCGQGAMISRDDIAVPRRLADQTAEFAPLEEGERAALDDLRERKTQRGGPDHGEPYPDLG